jgi:hypothetical protein
VLQHQRERDAAYKTEADEVELAARYTYSSAALLAISVLRRVATLSDCEDNCLLRGSSCYCAGSVTLECCLRLIPRKCSIIRFASTVAALYSCAHRAVRVRCAYWLLQEHSSSVHCCYKVAVAVAALFESAAAALQPQ